MATPADVTGDAATWVQEQVPYLWGGITRFGADCSGFVKSVFAEVGYTIAGRTSQQEATLGVPVAGLAAAQPGDLIFYNYEGPNSHVAIYAGNGEQYAETQTGQPATLQAVDTGAIGQIRRYIDASGNPTGPGITVSTPTPAAGPAGGPYYTLSSSSGSPDAQTTASIGGIHIPFTGGGGTSITDLPGAIASAIESPVINFVDSYAIRAALFLVGAIAIIIGLVRLFANTQAGKDAEHTAEDAGAAAALA